MSKPTGSNTRLAYSTSGDVPREVQRARKEGTATGPGGIRLRLDRRASGRLVTVVTGLPGTLAQVATLASELKAACGAGGTVKDGALELQGDHRNTVETALAARRLKSKRSGG